MIICMLIMYVALISQTAVPPTAVNGTENGQFINSDRKERQPNYEFGRVPLPMGINFDYYMPGGLNSSPVGLQHPTDEGIYIVNRRSETQEAVSRAWYAYIDENGELHIIDRLSTIVRQEGFPSIDIDPLSSNPIVAWNRLMANQTDWEVVYSYDVYSMMSEPGLWMSPLAIIDPLSSPHPNPAFDGDQFINPILLIGQSPMPDKRRVYVAAFNAEDNPVTGEQVANPVIAYADFDESDLWGQTQLDWNYNSIPGIDQWHLDGLRQPFMSMAVSETDGKLAFFGWNRVLDGDENATPLDKKLFIFVNENYGEGEWLYHSTPGYFELGEIENPTHANGDPMFPLEPGEELYWDIKFSNHQNSLFLDNDFKLITMQNLWLHKSDENQMPTDEHFDLFGFPKVFIFDFVTEEFTMYNVGLIGDPDLYHNTPVLPWDPYGEGIQYDEDGFVITELGWPIWHHDPEYAIYENKHKVAVNEEHGLVAAVWNQNITDPGSAGIPEIAIAISNDLGLSWHETIYLNPENVPELEDMIPAYTYPATQIEFLGYNDLGRLHLMFSSPNSYEPFPGIGASLGAEMYYAALDIDFYPCPPPPHADDNEIVAQSVMLQQNYPNPFNPETTIKFSLLQQSNVKLQIFNIRGQIVKTLLDEEKLPGEHMVAWNGKDDNGRELASAIYLYKLKSEKDVVTRKMMLLK